MQLRLGSHVFGFAAMAYGVIDLTWHQVTSLGGIAHPVLLIYVMAALELIGGITMQFQKTVKV